MSKEDLPFLTILTASLNGAPTIAETLESVRKQTFSGFEHIVIDGGSSDGTLDILRNFENSYNLTWISEPDRGISDALNKGLYLAKGRFIFVLHADDKLLTSDTLKRVYLDLEDHLFDIHSFPIILDHPTEGKVIRRPIRCQWWNHFKFIFLHQGAFVDRRVFESIGGFRERFTIAMDYDFFYRALSSNFSVRFGDFPVTLMGGAGIGSNPTFLSRRLEEESLVQYLNESNQLWRLAQSIFRMLYIPYKVRLAPKWKRSQTTSQPR